MYYIDIHMYIPILTNNVINFDKISVLLFIIGINIIEIIIINYEIIFNINR